MTKIRICKKLWCRGSFTVEASYLVPLILFLLVLIGTAALFLHDRSVSCYNAEAITIRGGMLALGNSEDADTQLDMYVSETGEKGFLMTTGTQASGSIGTWEITSSVEGAINNLFADTFSGLGWPVFEAFSASDVNRFVDPCTLIREARILTGGEADE